MNIREIAKRVTTFSELAVDRELISNEDIEKYYGEGITIINAEEVTVDDSRYYIYLFKEDDSKFAGSGTVLTRIFDEILEECDGDVEVFKKELARGELRVKLIKSKTKKNRDLFKIEVL